MPAFSVTFSIMEPQNRRRVYFKQDGQRFSSDRTIKFSTDVKYEIRVTIKPPVAPLRNLIIGGDQLMPDSSEDGPSQSTYLLTWFTNGHTPSKSGQRIDLPFVFNFDSIEFITKFQAKFYPVTDVKHLIWGTEIRQIQLEGRGEFETAGGGGPKKTLAPTNITFI